MACAAKPSNRLALFLFVKINIFPLNLFAHRGMGHEPLVKVSWPFIRLPRPGPRFALVAGLVRKVGRAPDLACGICDGLGWLCFGIGLWPCGWPFFVRQAVFRFWPKAVFRTGFASAGHWPVAAAIARTNLCVGEKQRANLSKPSRSQRTYFNLLCGHELLTCF